MELAEYKNIYENEEDHFYYRSVRNIAVSLLRRHSGEHAENLSILDAGCGTGYLSRELGHLGRVSAIDISEDAVSFAKKRGVNAAIASIEQIPFPDRSFDAVVSIDVLYHAAVQDDESALREFFRVLKPAGILIIRVPAKQWLFGRHDRFVHGRTRYEKKGLEEKLRRTGFTIELLSWSHMVLYPPAAIRRIMEFGSPNTAPSSAIRRVPKFLNVFLSLLLSIETFFLARTGLPFGIGLVAACRKK